MSNNISETPRDQPILGQQYEVQEGDQKKHSKASELAKVTLSQDSKKDLSTSASIKGKIAYFEADQKPADVASKINIVAHKALNKPPVAPKPSTTSERKPSGKEDKVQKHNASSKETAESKKNTYIAQLKQLSKMDGPQIAQLIAQLSQDSSSFTPEDQQGIHAAIKALKLLNSPQAFKSDHDETIILKQWDVFLKKHGVEPEVYKGAIKPVREELCKSLKKIIESNCNSLVKLKTVLDEAIPRLQASAIVKRIEKSVPKENREVVVEWCSVISDSVKALKAFKADVKIYCQQRWKEDIAKLDEKTEGKASEVIREVACFDPLATTSHLEKELESIFVKVDSQELEDSKKQIYEKVYKDNLRLYKPKIKWLQAHAVYIKQAYDQGKDDNRNMGEGTCFVNSLERYEALVKDPYILSEQVSMGSSLNGRMLQKMLDEERKVIQADPSKFESINQALSKRIGLNHTGTSSIPKSDDQQTSKTLLKVIHQLAKKSDTLFLLKLLPEKEGVGHAINLQYDQKQSLFRFMDDNLGVVQCPDAKSFGETLSSWLELMYSDLTEISVNTYSAA